MKKKKWLIALASALLLVVILLLFSPYLFPREVMTVEKIEDISQIAHLDEDDLLMTYEIRKMWRTMTISEREDWDWNTNQYATLCIFNNGAVYYFNTYKHLYSSMRNNFQNEPESIYYLGNISLSALWNLRYQMIEINQDGESIITYDDTWDLEVPDTTSFDSSVSVNNSDNSVDMENYIYQMKQEYYSYHLYFGENDSFRVVENIFRESHRSTNDPHALAALDWLRGTWYFEQYIDLMYQELYPWLVE